MRGEFLARVVCDRVAGVVYVNDVPIEGYVPATEESITVRGVAHGLMTVGIEVFAQSVELIDGYVPTMGNDVGNDVGVCYVAMPTMNPQLIGKIIR